jgi:hypothetical protein
LKIGDRVKFELYDGFWREGWIVDIEHTRLAGRLYKIYGTQDSWDGLKNYYEFETVLTEENVVACDYTTRS